MRLCGTLGSPTTTQREGTVRLFDPTSRQITPQQARRYATFEILHTIVDFLAAFLFVVGSALFFSETTKMAGTLCFLIGSLFFMAKPSIRLLREFWLARLNNVDSLAGKAPEGPGSFQELLDGDEGSHGDSRQVSPRNPEG